MSQSSPSNKKAAASPDGGFRQAMTWLHTWVGLTLGWVLFLIFVTGTAGYFDTEIDRWMQPELPMVEAPLSTLETANVVRARLEQEAPQAERWYISLPAGRNQLYPSVFWQGASEEAGASSARGRLTLDATTGETLTPRDTGGGQTLYQMHWRLHYLGRGYSDWIIGVATLFMMVGLVTGIIIHKKIFVDFFTFRPGKGQRSWLDAHNFFSVFALPFHLMITYSGLLFMGFSLMPLIVASHYGDEGRRQFYAEVFDPPGIVDAANTPAPLAPFADVINQAEQRWGPGRVQVVDVHHPQDANARVVLYESIDQTVSTSGERLVFDGVTGNLLHIEPADASMAKHVRDVFLGLHEGLFAGTALRWLYFLSGVLGTGMVATGLILWTAKRRKKAERKPGQTHRGLVLVEKLNIGTIAGLPAGMATYFWANRLLPLNMAGRGEWEVHILFLTWLAMLLYAAVRPRLKAWQELLAATGVLFAALPVLNALTTERHLLQSLTSGDWVFAGFDISVFVIGVGFTWAAWRVRASRYRASTTQVPLRKPRGNANNQEGIERDAVGSNS
ncbi:PepSY-associated TM helix domain-containing protein [uncultured Gilvimarinus sp.]|uniref:PepSY-associated TM helix domain-containing protein n=1 Tax=uncultured Gilvimarinus sp. TaxID=1689143 RepID=UPI0030EC3731|tara:strand:- start:139 stop:1815 length:1677 start_codon:yes stop_codon:yes gene_type:complete